MPTLERRQVPRRYKVVSEQKANGATYTPSPLADFVAKHVAESADFDALGKPLHILDPAIGDGELVISLLQALGFQKQLSRCSRKTSYPLCRKHTVTALKTDVSTSVDCSST
jgi:hypothetical protein